MALILPGQQQAGGIRTPKSTDLILPGKTTPEQTAQIVAKREKISALRTDAAAADKAATAAEATGKFTAKNIATETLKVIRGAAQGTARSAGAAATALATGQLDKGLKPESKLDKAIFGEGEVSFRGIGEDFAPLLEMAGVPNAKARAFAPYIGVALGSLDLTPFGAGKSGVAKLLAEESLGKLAKEASEEAILKAIRPAVKGEVDKVKALASAIAKADTPADVKKLIELATTKPEPVRVPRTELPKLEKLTVPEPLKHYAESIVDQAYSKSEFLARLGRAVESIDDNVAMDAIQFKNELKEAGFTPGRFYDTAHGRPVIRTSEVPTTRTTTGRATGRTIAENTRRTESVIQRGEYKLLKERIQAMSSAAKTGAKVTREEIKRYQSDFIKLIQKNLPPTLRGKLLTQVRNTQDLGTLDRSMDALAEHIVSYELLRSQAKNLGKARSRVAFIRKIAELNQTGVNDAKRAIGVEKPLRKMTEGEVKSLSNELIKRLQFKRQEGLFEKSAPRKSATELSEAQIDEYAAAQQGAGTFANRAAQNIRNTTDALTKTGDLITIPSEALRAIGAEPVLTSLRKMGSQARKFTQEGEAVVSEIITKLGLDKRLGKRAISDRDYAALDLAMKNGAIDTVMNIAEKYGVKGEFEKLRPILDGIFERANEVDLDVEYRKNFFPRSFKTDNTTREAATEYFEKEYGDVLAQAYSDFATKMGRFPNPEEKWKIINNLMRGFKQQGITLSKTGSLKRRKINEVTPDTADFYQNSFSALQEYMESANNLIEARRFFGKHVDLKNVPGETELSDVAGIVIDKLVASGQLEAKNSERLREILQARFTGGKMNAFLQLWKNGSYLSIMGDVISAVTQIGDFEKVMYRAGLNKAIPAIFKTVFNPTAQEIRLADLGLDKTIAAEMSNASATGRLVNDVFKSVGLSWMDRLGKESFINGVISKYRTAIQSGDEKFLTMARRVLGPEAEQTFKDLAAGDMTENVKFLALNELADFFPVTLEEVPIQYLKSPNGRIFYTMKTFTTKQLNTYRREILEVAKKDRVQASKNLARLVGFFVVMNMTADEIKGWIRGDDKSFSDKLADNMLKTIGFGKYQLDQASSQGFGRTLLEQGLPPTSFIDDAVKDFNDVFIKRESKGLRSTKNIPVGGELYYWWFGRGAANTSTSGGEERVYSNDDSISDDSFGLRPFN